MTIKTRVLEVSELLLALSGDPEKYFKVEARRCACALWRSLPPPPEGHRWAIGRRWVQAQHEGHRAIEFMAYLAPVSARIC